MIIKELYVKYKKVIAYIFFGGLTTVVSLGSYYFCVLTFLNPQNAVQLQVANIISWICAVTFAYITNRKYVFESKSPNVVVEISKFFGTRLSTLIIDMACMALFVSVLCINDKIAKLIVQVLILVLNYLFSEFLVFTKK